VLAPYIFLPAWTTQTFGPISGSHPAFFLATWAPALAAVCVVPWCAGLSGLKAFLSRLLLWRCPRSWVMFILFGIPVLYIAGSLFKGGPLLAPAPPGGIGAMASLLLLMLFLGPVEEFGWRGVLQPILQRHVAPIWAGGIIGMIWGIWHLPAFFLSGTVFADWDFLPFFIGNITLAVLVTSLFNSTRGSLLWPMLFHWQLINPIWPDGQPYDTWILIGVTLIMVRANRASLFSRAGAVTSVIVGRAHVPA
jgi:membrane protease YdiL (CAAX protease family)